MLLLSGSCLPLHRLLDFWGFVLFSFFILGGGGWVGWIFFFVLGGGGGGGWGVLAVLGV